MTGRYRVFRGFSSGPSTWSARPGTPLAIGGGLGEWARTYRAPEAAAARAAARRWLRPHELALALLEALGEHAGAAFLSLFRIDDLGYVHVKARGQAIAIGLLAGLLVLAFELVFVAAYNAGVAEGMAAAWRLR